MRTGLDAEFVSELTRRGRAPRQLLEFLFASGTVYVSDQNMVGKLADVYLPLVESWGSLEDTSVLQDILNGTDSGTRQLSVSLFNSRENPFSAHFIDEAPENVKVRLYQWFEGTRENSKALVAEMVIQDPISYSEAGGMLQLDLVSVNQYADPYIGQLSPTDNNFYGVVLGSISRAVGTTYGSRPIVQLDGDLSDTATTIPCVGSPSAAGFPASGHLVLDYEVIQYTGTTAASFTGCTRVAYNQWWSAPFPHADGQDIFLLHHEYLYSFGQGPLEAMGPVYLDGEIYAGQYTIYKDRNPVQVGFMHSDPFVRGTGPAITKDVSSYGTVGAYGGNLYLTNWSALKTDCIYYSVRGRYSIGNTLGANTFYFYWSIAVPVSITNFSEYSSGSIFVKGNAWSYQVPSGPLQTSKTKFNGTTIVTSGLNTGVYYGEATFGYESWGALTGSKLASNEYFSSGAAQAVHQSGDFNCLTSSATYKPYVKSHSTGVACDLSSGSGSSNPADAITMVLSIIGIAGAIDTTSFATAKAWFTAQAYEFTGLIAGDLRCREVLAEMCRQSRSRLVYNGGTIKLVVRHHLSDKSVDRSFNAGNPGDVRLKSISVIRQNVADILNKITIRYNATVLEEYNSTKVVSDSESIATFGLHEEVWDFFLVDDATMAAGLADFYLEEMAKPYTYVSFEAYLHAFSVEQEDTVRLYSDFSDLFVFTGCVGTVVRNFGSGKNKMINNFLVTMYGRPAAAIIMELADSIAASDEFSDVGIDLAVNDTVAATEQLAGVLPADQDGYGRGGYGRGGYGV